MSDCSVRAVVTDTDADSAVLLVEPAAEKCASCGSFFCGVRKGRSLTLSIPGAAVGDRFALFLSGKSITFISFWCYIAGLLVAVLAAWLVRGRSEFISAVVFLITVALWMPLCAGRLGTYAKKKIGIVRL